MRTCPRTVHPTGQLGSGAQTRGQAQQLLLEAASRAEVNALRREDASRLYARAAELFERQEDFAEADRVRGLSVRLQ